MGSDDIDFGVNLDAQGYVLGATSVAQQNIRLGQSFSALALQSVGVQRALDAVTPKRAMIIGFGALATSAASSEAAMSGFQATASLTGANFEKLSASSRQLARDLPIGGSQARSVVQAFTQMGVAGAGSEERISKLATSVAKLSGATGEAPIALAAGMTDLARATGNTALDPVRFEKLGDSLSKVSAESGAGASNILSFSKNIAPMAGAAGIGATGVLGISSAFARLGEDGVGASTAVNKMLSDLNKSVREGTPEIKTYASFVGQTADQFEALFKSNPAEALTQITEAIGKAGPQGQRMLESIGVEGVRGQRSLQALSASGGLRPAIASSMEAYGSGSTDKASQAAFGGFNDSVSMLTETTKQLGEALGTPLLGPLTAFTNALKIPANVARSVAESGFVQKAIQIGGAAAMAFMVARSIAGPLGAFGIGRGIATSGPVRALAAGWAQGETRTAAGRYGAQVTKLAEEEGVYGRGMTAGLARRAYGFASGLRDSREASLLARMGPEAYEARRQRIETGLSAPGGESPIKRMVRGGSGYMAAAVETYGNVLRQTYRDGHVPVSERGPVTTSPMGAPMRGTMAYETARQQWRSGGGITGGFGNIRDTFRTFNTTLNESASATKHWTNAIGAHGKALAAAGGLIGAGFRDTAKASGSMLKRAATSTVGQLGGGVGLGIAAATGLYQVKQTLDQNNESFKNDFANSDISGTLNAYRESIGKATSAMVTVSTLSESMGKAIAMGTKTFADARTVSSKDINVAEGSPGKSTNQFIGNDNAVIAQIGAINPMGLAPDELQAVKEDLIRQRGASGAKRILDQLPASAMNTGQEVPKGGDPVGIIQQMGAISAEPTTGGWPGIANKLDTWGGIKQMFGGGPNWNGPKDAFYASDTSEKSGQALDLLVKDIDKRFQAQSKYGGDYAQQERLKNANTAYDAAVRTNNVDLVNETSKRLTSLLGGKEAMTYVNPDDAKKYGSFTSAFGAQNSQFGQGLNDFNERQKAAGGDFKPVMQSGYVHDILKGIAPTFAAFFDEQSKSPAAQATVASMNNQGDVGKLAAAVQAQVDAARASGKSMADLGAEAAKAGGSLSEANHEFAIVAATQHRTEVEMARDAVNQTPTQTAMARYSYVHQIATQAPTNNQATEADRQAKQQEEIALKQSFKDRMSARLMAAYQAHVQETRANEDFTTNRKRQEFDYGVQVTRIKVSFALQQSRTVEDYNKQAQRSDDDYGTARMRANRDFGIQMTRGEQDYQKSRRRTLLDYNIGLIRSDQDYQKSRRRTLLDYNIGLVRSEEDYQKSRFRTMRDYNIQMQRGEEDFQKSRSRSIRDYNIQLARQVEDAAKSMYDPYARIQTKATWDAANLLVNMKEQNAAIAKQKEQLDALRKMGLSGQAIDQLQLGKAENAQQVNNLTQDLGKDPSLVGQLNQTAQQRQGLTSSMFFDASNTDLKRSQEDFRKSLDDQSADYKQSIDRSLEDLNKGLQQQADDYSQMLIRGAEDLRKGLDQSEQDYRQMLERGAEDLSKGLSQQEEDYRQSITRGVEDLAKGLDDMEFEFKKNLLRSGDDLKQALRRGEDDLHTTLNNMDDDISRSWDRQSEDLARNLERMHEDLRNADLVISGDFQQIADATYKALHGQAVDYGKLLTNDTSAFIDQMRSQIVPGIQGIANDLGITLPGMQQTVQGQANHYAAMDKSQGLAMGGPVQGNSPHPKADDILIKATSGEFMQPVDAVKHYGVNTMEKIRTKKIPKEKLEGFADGGLVGYAGGGSVGGGSGRTSSEAIAAAMNQMTNVVGTCLAVVQEWWQSGHAYPDAWAQWLNTDQHPGDRNPPTGAPVFFSGGAHGHVAVALGNGMIRGTDAPTSGQVGNVPIEWIEKNWNHPYVGWGGTLASTQLRFDGAGAVNAATSGVSGGGGSGPTRPAVDIEKAFAGMDPKRGGWYGMLRDEFKTKVGEMFANAGATGSAGGGSSAAYNGTGGAAQWTSLVDMVLDMLGQSRASEGAVLRRIDFESSGNPRAINLTDSNAIAGHPSKGLMQTIQSTFDQYRNPALSPDIYDPEANIYAGSNYAIKTYGSLGAIDPLNRPKGYDDGGVMEPGHGQHFNGTQKPEMVLTNEQWTSIHDLAERGGDMVSAEQGKQLTAAGGVHLTIDRRTITYDQRNDFNGAQFTVQASNMDEMTASMEKEAWMARATRTRSVNRHD